MRFYHTEPSNCMYTSTNWVIIDSSDGSLHCRHPAMTCTKCELSSFAQYEENVNDIWIGILNCCWEENKLENVVWKLPTRCSRPQCDKVDCCVDVSRKTQSMCLVINIMFNDPLLSFGRYCGQITHTEGLLSISRIYCCSWSHHRSNNGNE